MPVQGSTDYLAQHVAGYEGQRADFGLQNTFSKACELAAGINFGRAVVRGTADDQALLPTATGQDFVGVTIETTAWAENGSDEHLYEQYREMNIMDIGPLWVITEQSVVPGDPVFFRHTAKGANIVVGRFRKDADVNTADEIQGATFESTSGAGAIALIWLRGNASSLQVYEVTTAVAAGALSLVTRVSQFNTTLGAATATLADGEEGQLKILEMIVNGGAMIVTPANLFNGTTITFNNVGDAAALLFINGAWHVVSQIGVEGVSGPFVDPTVETITAVGPTAVSLLTSTTLFDTTLGAATATLADGQNGQVKRLKMTVDGGDMVLTPANLADGATLTFSRVGDECVLQFFGTEWEVMSYNGVQGIGNAAIQIRPTVETVTVAGANVFSVATDLTLIDTTLGAATGTLADGEIGQIKEIYMIADGGDMVLTPASLADGVTLTFNRVGSAATLKFTGTEWHALSSKGVQGLDIDAVEIKETTETITAVGPTAISLVTDTTLFDTTLGAATATLADGEVGQIKTLKMTVDGGAMVVTPANLTDGTTLTFNRVGQWITLQFLGAAWSAISNNGVLGLGVDVIEIINPSLETVTFSGATALSLVVNTHFFDTTTGAQTGTLADGEEGQKKFLKMTVDGVADMVITPTHFANGTTITFDDVGDSIELLFLGGTWHTLSTPTATVA